MPTLIPNYLFSKLLHTIFWLENLKRQIGRARYRWKENIRMDWR